MDNQELLDTAVNSVNSRVQQQSLKLYLSMEHLILSAANGDVIAAEQVRTITEHFRSDLDERKLIWHLALLPDVVKDTKDTAKQLQLSDVIASIKGLGPAARMCSEVAKLIRLLLVIPATSATAERSFSSLMRLKTYLRTTMTQRRLNNLLILHIHQEETDAINLNTVARQFVAKGDNRCTIFGGF